MSSDHSVATYSPWPPREEAVACSCPDRTVVAMGIALAVIGTLLFVAMLFFFVSAVAVTNLDGDRYTDSDPMTEAATDTARTSLHR